MAMPRETARPWTEKVMVSPPGRPKAKRGPLGGQDATRSARTWGPSFALAELVDDQGGDRLEGFLLAFAVRLYDDFAAQARRQHHLAHDALRIHAPVAPAHPDIARITGGELRELRRGAGMQAQLIADGRARLHHCCVGAGSGAPCWPPASRLACRRPRRGTRAHRAARGDSSPRAAAWAGSRP